MTKVKVKASVPTVHQLYSLLTLVGSDVNFHPNGTIEFEREFDNEQEAKQFMFERAWKLADSYGQYLELVEDITKSNTFRFDKIGCFIDS